MARTVPVIICCVSTATHDREKGELADRNLHVRRIKLLNILPSPL